jgi:hypothetical protein
VEVVEKKDFFVITLGVDKVKVDVLGNLVEGSPPSNAPSVLTVSYVDPQGMQTIPTPSEYSSQIRDAVGSILRSRKNFPATVTEVICNKADFVLFDNGKKFCLVAPKNFNPNNYSTKIPQGAKRVFLENIQGIFAKTSQGSMIVFGDDSDMDIKMGSVAKLLEGYRLERQPFPTVIKADIPYQVTIAP